MSSEPGRPGMRSSDPPTLPLPRLTAEEEGVLPPLESPRVPELDDRALARLLAELDGEDDGPSDGGAARVDRSGTESGDPPSGRGGAGEGDEPRPDGERARVPYPRQSAYGPVIPSPYGEHRPPVRPATAEPTTLTGLGPLSRGKLGSRLFTLAFVAIFLLILVQTLISLFTA